MKDNLQHIAGILVGKTWLRATGRRYGKDARGTRWFSTVAANMAANGYAVQLFPYAWSAA